MKIDGKLYFPTYSKVLYARDFGLQLHHELEIDYRAIKSVLKAEGNNDVYVMLDSGSTRNWFYYSLLEKINVTEDDFIQKVVEYIKQNELELIKNHSSEKEVAQYLKNEWSNYNLNYL